MESLRFDQMTRLFADRKRARRTARAPVEAAAPAVKDSSDKVEYLFVQSFQSGSIVPKESEGGSFALTLEHGLGQTVYFSDRPERVVGALPTGRFLNTFPFGATNSPNAALVLTAGLDEVDVVVLELSAPEYDQATHTATYSAKLLADDEQLGGTFQQEPKGVADLPAAFGVATLLIDDCPDLTRCVTAPTSWGDSHVTEVGPLPGGSAGQCWQWSSLSCEPCRNGQDYYNGLCDSAYADCQGNCVADVTA